MSEAQAIALAENPLLHKLLDKYGKNVYERWRQQVPGLPDAEHRALLAEAQAVKKIGNYIDAQCREIIDGTVKQRSNSQ